MSNYYLIARVTNLNHTQPDAAVVVKFSEDDLYSWLEQLDSGNILGHSDLRSLTYTLGFEHTWVVTNTSLLAPVDSCGSTWNVLPESDLAALASGPEFHSTVFFREVYPDSEEMYIHITDHKYGKPVDFWMSEHIFLPHLKARVKGEPCED